MTRLAFLGTITAGILGLGLLGGATTLMPEAGPAPDHEWTVSDGARLAQIARRLRPGDEVRLGAGHFGALQLEKIAGTAEDPITFRSADPAHPATIARMDLREVSHLVFDGLTFDYDYKSGDDPNLRPFQIFAARDVTIRDSVFDGDLAPPAPGMTEDGPLPTAFGLAVRASAGFTFERNEIRRFYRGLMINDTVDVAVRDNDVHSIRMDGMDFAQVQRVVITGNQLHDFLRARTAGDHADMIQFWTAGTERPSTDIEISNNLLNSGRGLFTQSIMMRNEMVDRGEAGEGMYYRNVTIRNNVIINAHLHGITLGETQTAKIENNTLIHNAFSDGEKADPELWVPQIRVARASRDVVIAKNAVAEINGPVGQSDWQVYDNLLIQDAAPTRPNYYDALFVGARTGLPDDLSNFAYLPGGKLAGSGIGAPQLDMLAAVGSVQPVIRAKPAADGHTRLIFDAAASVLPEGVDPTKVRYDWTIGQGAAYQGAQVPVSFDRPGNYPVALQMTLPDGQTRSVQGQVAVRDSRVLTFDPQIGRLISHVAAEPEAVATIPVSPGALEFGQGGGSIKVAPNLIAPFFGAEAFSLSMRLRAMGNYKDRGEIVRIHKSLIIRATGRGGLIVDFHPANGQRLLLETRAIHLFDGNWHDLDFAYSSDRETFTVRADGVEIGHGRVSGETRPMEFWGLSLGNSFGSKDSFYGEIDKFELDATGPAVSGVL